MARRILLIALLVVVGGYLAYPYVALYRLEGAVARHDTAALDSMVDWPRVRQDFKDRIGDTVAKPDAQDDAVSRFGAALSRNLLGGAVDSVVTPETLITLIQTGRFDRAALSTLLGGTTPAHPPRTVWAFFSGPASFDAKLRGADQPEDEAPVELRFELIDGGWLVTRVVVPSAK